MADRQVSWPWGRAAALLGGSLATLIGVARGLEPDAILVRAVGSALIFGFLASTCSVIVERYFRSG
jgi:hypothetical protein